MTGIPALQTPQSDAGTTTCRPKDRTSLGLRCHDEVAGTETKEDRTRGCSTIGRRHWLSRRAKTYLCF